jgi:hypothetical protein
MINTPKALSRVRISFEAFYQVVIVLIAVSYSKGTVFESRSGDGLS